MTFLEWTIVALVVAGAILFGFGLWKKRPDVAIGAGLFTAALLAIAKLIPDKKNLEEATDPTKEIPKPTYTSTTSTVELETDVKKNEIEIRAELSSDQSALVDHIHGRNSAKKGTRSGDDS